MHRRMRRASTANSDSSRSVTNSWKPELRIRRCSDRCVPEWSAAWRASLLLDPEAMPHDTRGIAAAIERALLEIDAAIAPHQDHGRAACTVIGGDDEGR